jgi:hypothetical protein
MVRLTSVEENGAKKLNVDQYGERFLRKTKTNLAHKIRNPT